jgi:glycosyltransferase involved in cell wall biosynthesis
MTPCQDPIRIVRVIARLNIGGPAIQAITLTQRLQASGYSTRLVRGREGADEGSMDYLADQLGVCPTLLPTMRREPGWGDLRALLSLIRILRRDRPDIVHTHAAMGGTLGRLATLIAFPLRRRRPVLIHTFHGHSLTGYFSSRTAQMFRSIEKALARHTDALIAVSAEVRDDLVKLGVANQERFTVIPLGFDLSDFVDDTDRSTRRAALRAEWGIRPDEQIVTLVARLVPIKRVDRFLRVAGLLAQRPETRFVIVGDGELRHELVRSRDAHALGDRLLWAGFRRDIPDVCFASDVVVLTSDNEGTPVSLIEAAAAAVPVVATDVGGVRSVVDHGRTGMLVSPDDAEALASHIRALLDNPEDARALGRNARRAASKAFTTQALVNNLDNLYTSLLRAH